MAANAAAAKTPLNSYQKRLFVFLSVATFFEGYDFFALSQLLPNIRATYGLAPSDGAHLVTVINIGTVLAFLIIRKADDWGRRRVLSLTILGYTLFSFLSGLAPNVYLFAIAQMLARIFLISEWAISMVYAAEEFPAERRGMVIGVIQGFVSFGAITCAGLIPMFLSISSVQVSISDKPQKTTIIDVSEETPGKVKLLLSDPEGVAAGAKGFLLQKDQSKIEGSDFSVTFREPKSKMIEISIDEKMVPQHFDKSFLGVPGGQHWRLVYFAGAIPLLLLAFARRNIKETKRFEETGPVQRLPLTRIFRTPHRKRVLQLALIWGLTYMCTNNAITFWKEFVTDPLPLGRSFTDKQEGTAIMIASLVALPVLFFAGRFIDGVGRRIGATIIFLTTSVAVYLAYTLHSHIGLTIALALGIFGTNAVLSVLNAYTTELFPTDLRGDAFAWSNNLLGRIGYVLSPEIIALVVNDVGWGSAVSFTAIFPLLALLFILWLLPETKGKELEETSSAH